MRKNYQAELPPVQDGTKFEGERERDRQRQTDRQTDRQTVKEM